MIQKVNDIRPSAGEKIVDANHLMALLEQPLAEVGTQKAGTPGDN
jgi:hypothetical protein